MELKALIENYDRGFIEAEYEDTGFVIQVRPMCQALQDEIAPKVKGIKFDKTTHKKIEVMDDEKFAKVFSKIAIVGWSGLSIAITARLVPSLKIPDGVNKSEEIPCTAEAKHMLMVRSSDFQKFILDVAMDAGSVMDEQMEEETKNLSSSQRGAEAGEPSPAPSATGSGQS